MMNEIPREPSTAWWFSRKAAVLIVADAMLMLALVGAACVYLPYQRELQIARQVESVGGEVGVRFCGLDWTPNSVQVRLSFWNRISSVGLQDTQISDTGLESLKELTSLTYHYLNNTKITDIGLENLKGLTSLTDLSRDNTKITDAGLEHLQGLSNLRRLFLGNTQVTDDDLKHLKG